jgi:hypothetical protein
MIAIIRALLTVHSRLDVLLLRMNEGPNLIGLYRPRCAP